MSDTEAGFALMADKDIVSFIKAHKGRKDARYEVKCALQVLGYDLVKKYELLPVTKLFGGLRRCKCEDCLETGTEFYVWGEGQ